MKERRTNRLGDELRDIAARFLEESSDRSSLLTITRVELLSDGKLLRCYLSVFPPAKQAVAVGFANRNTSALRDFVASTTKMRFTPRFEFVPDQGEKNRQRIDELLRK